MVGIVVVSHSRKIAEGIVEMARQMSRPEQALIAAGGMEDGGIGTDAMRVQAAVSQADSGDGVVIMVDLGSAVLSAETALEFLPEELQKRVRIADAPVLEGSIAATVEASLGSDLAKVVQTAEDARNLKKC